MKRVSCWILFLIISFAFFYGEGWYKNATADKKPLYVYAPEYLENAFKVPLKCSGLNSEYEIVITKDISQANIIIDTDKEFDSDFFKIAYSPFVVVYSQEDDNLKDMIKAGLLQEASFNDDYYEINFKMVIEEVLAEGKWKNLGVENQDILRVFYPAPGSKYYTDYYDFMLVTINGGAYPKNETELKSAMEKIKLFENSVYTEGVVDFGEKLLRSGGFLEDTLFLMPEQEAERIDEKYKKYGRLFYPTVTVYVDYYLKADELGYKLVEAFYEYTFWDGSFYDQIENYAYRNEVDSELDDFTGYLYHDRDAYNVLNLDSNRIRPESVNGFEEASVS